MGEVTHRPTLDQMPVAPTGIVGWVRRFGVRGVPYEVLSINGAEANIRVITTGEKTTYPVADVLTDPED